MVLDMTGKRCGRLVVMSREGKDHRGEITWRAKCDCGNEIVALGSNLRTGNTQSCGCLHTEQRRNIAYNMSQGNITHGESGSRLWRIWDGMKQRCYNSRRPFYEYYGGRGIGVCQAWLDNFPAFRDWSLQNGYKDGLEIDRRDNDKGYSPKNCRWATRKEQMRNTRGCRKIELFGEVKSIVEWSEDNRCEVSERALRSRLARGWTLEEALVA